MPKVPTHSVDPDDLLGAVLDDRYRLVRVVGQGGMGTVYEGLRVKLEKRVAIKVLRPALARQEVHRRRFFREAKAASKLDHPHVVSITDFGDAPEGPAYFVMEYLEGKDLAALLAAHGVLPWSQARDLLLQVLSALSAAHAQGIVHRDIKPANCFIVDDPHRGTTLKVLDFGIAKIDPGASQSGGLTATNEIFGTTTYMAPEQATSGTVDARTDIYAVGVLAYRMLTGRVPFQGATPYETLTLHCTEPPTPLRDVQPTIDPRVEAIVLRALEKDPAQRFASADELMEALAGVDQATDAIPPPRAASPSAPIEPTEHLPPLVSEGGTAGPTEPTLLDPAEPSGDAGDAVAAEAPPEAHGRGAEAEDAAPDDAAAETSRITGTATGETTHLQRERTRHNRRLGFGIGLGAALAVLLAVVVGYAFIDPPREHAVTDGPWPVVKSGLPLEDETPSDQLQIGDEPDVGAVRDLGPDDGGSGGSGGSGGPVVVVPPNERKRNPIRRRPKNTDTKNTDPTNSQTTQTEVTTTGPSDTECATAPNCSVYGQCVARDGKCVAGSDAHCSASTTCKNEGRCSERDGECVVTSDADCRLSYKCSNNGQCTAKGGKCIAGSDTDCRDNYHECKIYGRCTAHEGRCIVASDEDCRQHSGLCKRKGKCTATGGACTAGSDDDCRGNDPCTFSGQCTAREGRCVVASDADCRDRSNQCRVYAKCTASGGKCTIASDADCRAADACKSLGWCRLQDGKCVE